MVQSWLNFPSLVDLILVKKIKIWSKVRSLFDKQAQRLQLGFIQRLLFDLFPFHLRHLYEKEIIEINLYPEPNHPPYSSTKDNKKDNELKKVEVSEMIRKLIDIIEEEFQSINQNTSQQNNNAKQFQKGRQKYHKYNLSGDDLMLYSKAIYCVTFIQTFHNKCEQKPRKQLSIFSYSHNEQQDPTLFQFFNKYNHLQQHLNTETLMFQSLVAQIDEKINCQPIARCLRIELRIKVCLMNQGFSELTHLINLLMYNKWATVNANNGLLNSNFSSYYRFFQFLEENPCLKKDIMIKYNFLHVIAENHFNIIPVVMRGGNFFKLCSVFDQISYLLIFNKKYFQLQDLRMSFTKIKQFLVQNIQALYSEYNITQKSIAPVPILGFQTFRLLQSLEILKIQLNMEQMHTVGYFAKLKQIFGVYKSLYQTNQGVLRLIPSKDCQFQCRYSLRSMLYIIFEIINQTYYGPLLIKGWENITFSLKYYPSVFSIQISQKFQHIFINIFASGQFKILSQSVLLAIQQIMKNNIIASNFRGFNMTLKIVMANEKQTFKKFLEIFFKEVKEPFGNNFHQKLYLCLFYINILDFSEYFVNHPYLWKRLLILLYRNFEMYPKLKFQPYQLGQQRYHKVILITINYLDYLRKERKRNVFIRTFVKSFKGENMFYGVQVIEWINKFMSSQGQNAIDNKSRWMIKKKKFEYLQNVIQNSQEGRSGTNSRKRRDFIRIFNETILTREYCTYSSTLQREAVLTKLSKHIKQQYNIPILYPLVKLHTPTLIELMGLRDQFRMVKYQNVKIKSYEQSKNMTIQRINLKYLQIIKRGQLQKRLGSHNQEMKNFIQQTKKSDIYELSSQLTSLAIDLINEQKKWLSESRFKVKSISINK